MSEETLNSRQAAKIGPSLQSVASDTREAIHQAVEHGQKHASRWYGEARDQAKHLKDVGAQQYEVIRGHVERHAMMSTLIGFAAGFVVARFLFRR